MNGSRRKTDKKREKVTEAERKTDTRGLNKKEWRIYEEKLQENLEVCFPCIYLNFNKTNCVQISVGVSYGCCEKLGKRRDFGRLVNCQFYLGKKHTHVY